MVNDEWKKEHSGVACFVKDNVKKSYFIRVVDLEVSFQGVISDQKVSVPTRYTYTHRNFHLVLMGLGESSCFDGTWRELF